MKTELHCHTTISDGSYSFEELAGAALNENIGVLAVTNHDTTKGLVAMLERGRDLGLEMIPGIEISAYDMERSRRVHILGYFIEPGHPALEQVCTPMIHKRHEAARVMVERLIEAGYSITWDQVLRYADGGTGVYKQHIMHALIDNGYAKSIYGELYKKLFSRGGNGEEPGMAYVRLDYLHARDAIEAVIQAGGVPVLAHPGQYGNFEYVRELVGMGLQGIEVWHSLHGADDEERAMEYARRYDLVMTGGSDFHGFYGEKEVRLGSKDPGISCVQELKKRRPN
ncbi:PHP domain-containing protein [Paenibacillus favisporus]|uniref:PHP domain-containing protein n=1 Tax=Paenibacillus favisporus TaxID=221028 RepID=UPI0033994E10